MPKTLSRREFLQQRPDGDYSKYLSYLARVRPRRAAKRQAQLQNAWMQPWTEQQIAQRSRQEVMSGVNPAIAAAEGAIGRRSKAGSSAITGYTSELANALMPFFQSAGSIYDAAAGSQGALMAALPAALTGQGRELGGELGAKMAQINAPGAQIDQVAGGAERTGAAAGAVSGALGSAELARLRSDQQADRAYAGAQPGIAGLRGAENSRTLQLQLNRELADTLGEITSRVPSQMSELVRSYRQDEFDKGIARETLSQEERQLRQKYLEMRAEAKTDAEKSALDRWYKEQKLALEAGRLSVSQQNAATTAAKAAAGAAAKAADKAAEVKADKRTTQTDARAAVFARAQEIADATAKNPDTGIPSPRYTREQAYRMLKNQYVAPLRAAGYSSRIIKQMIERALAAAGY